MPDVETHTYQYIENIQCSPQTFYQALDHAIQRRQLPGMKQTRVEYHEGSILSAKREYLRLKRGSIIFDICAAPFGTGFFFSWRLVRPKRSWIKLSSTVIALSFISSLFIPLFLAIDAHGQEALEYFIQIFVLHAAWSVINFSIYWVLRT